MGVATSWIVGAVCVSLGVGIGMAAATPQMLTGAKSAGMPAKSCQYCHTDALPKKDTFKPESLNERGKFLLADMKQRGLKAPDIEKLKDYPGGKEQK
jgi:hypothetical protein